MENRKILYSKLDKFIRKYYLNQLIRGGILTLLSLLVLFIFISILEHYMNFDVMFRTFLFWTYIIINSIIISKFILAPILQLLKISKGLKHKDAAKIIGNHFHTVLLCFEWIIKRINGEGPKGGAPTARQMM